MAKVEKITIKGYKSIKSLEDFELKNLNILIGANGVGKSNFISAFTLLNKMCNKELQSYTQSKSPDNFLHFGRKHTERIFFEFKFASNKYNVEFIPTQENKLLIKDEKGYFFGLMKNITVNLGQNLEESHLSEIEKYSSSKAVADYIKNSIQQWKVYHFHDTSDTSKMKGKPASNDNLIFKQDAANLASYLKMIKDKHIAHYEQIVATIQMVAPFFGGFVLRDDEFIQLEWFDKTDSDTPFKAHYLSDGTLRFIALATLLLQPFELMPDTLIIDEPELGLHPFALCILSELIKRASVEKQVIISSQSVELINYFEPQDIIVVDREDNQSTFKRLNAEDLRDWLEDYSLGEIWKSNLIGGRPK
ncbi:AAA family ATPase [Campylobacter troglodytis]|uniref:AAA family ATPase n=1 Tax=Campylobacter troglodytis TaxID=654363 RepID=UPI00115BF352|nr:AAA family ATPase [Campylobacter troglodytis]TQR60473.1 chromosome segregation protein SMC [Campylobacter troglodytis]